MHSLSLKGRLASTRALAQQAARRPLRRLCALSLERSGPTDSRKSKPNAQTQAAAAQLAVVDLDLDVDGVRAELEDVQSAYDAGYKAGLAAAREGLSAEAEKARPQHDSLLRSIVKAFSWRFFSTATTIILTMTFFNATLDEALEMGAAEFLSKYFLFLVHERLWILVTLF